MYKLFAIGLLKYSVKSSFNSKENFSFCFIVVGSSAGSGAKSPSTEDRGREPQAPKMRLSQMEQGAHIFVVKFLIQTHIKHHE